MKIRIASIIGILILLLSGCESEQREHETFATLTLTVEKEAPKRSIAPADEDNINISYYVLEGSGPHGSKLGPLESNNHQFIVEHIPTGVWSFSATAYNSSSNPLSYGVLSSCYLSSASANSVEIVLDQYVGKGSLRVELEWESASLFGLSKLCYTLLEKESVIKQECVENISMSEESYLIEIEELAAGFYSLLVSFSCDGETLGGFIESVRIVDGACSSAQRTLAIEKVAEENHITIVDTTATPIEGVITCDFEASPLTLTYTPTLPIGIDEEDLTLQWYCDGLPLTSENGYTLEIPNRLGGTYRYDVVVSLDKSGSVGSAHYLLITEVIPSIVEE